MQKAVWKFFEQFHFLNLQGGGGEKLEKSEKKNDMYCIC